MTAVCLVLNSLVQNPEVVKVTLKLIRVTVLQHANNTFYIRCVMISMTFV